MKGQYISLQGFYVNSTLLNLSSRHLYLMILLRNTERSTSISAIPVAVSYTHLDVYKRQHNSR